MSEKSPERSAEGGEGNVRFMRQSLPLDYLAYHSPLSHEFNARLAKREIPGHKCPRCGLVYCPPKGYCPMCVVATGDDDEVMVQDTGTITTFTVITPIQYKGQEETEDYTIANILLDGADQSLMQQRLGGVANNEVRAGRRVRAGGKDRRDGAGMAGAIEHGTPSGEPDVDPNRFQEHVL